MHIECRKWTVLRDLTRIFATVFQRPIVLTTDLQPIDVAGWDSFKFIEIILEMEKNFDIRLGARDLDRIETVGDFVDTIVRTIK
jgi:acyl carrier protein